MNATAAKPLKTNHGVLYNVGGYQMALRTAKEQLAFEPRAFDLAALYDLAVDNKLTHLWIHASCKLEVLEKLDEDFNFWYTWKYDEQIAKTVGKNPLVSCYGRRLLRPYAPGVPQRKSYNLFIIFLDQVLWDWPKDATPADLLTWIAELEGKLDVSISGSPSGVGLRYLKHLYAAKPHMLTRPEADLAALPWHEAAKPMIWRRVPSDEELNGALHLLAVDKNGAFPRAGQEERFGVGEPEHHQHVLVEASTVDFKVPGIWHIDHVVADAAPATTLIVQGLIPSPLQKTAQWVATPVLKALVKSGYHVLIDEFWVFPRHAPLFKKWVEELWALRQSCEPGSILRESYKQVMNDTLGLMRSTKFSGESVAARPDWNCQVVGGCYANVTFNILKFAREGFYPIMAQVDALYYLTRYPDANMAIPGIVDNAKSLGGYKVKWCLPLTASVRNLLISSTMAQSKLLQQLNSLAANQVEEHIW